MTDYNKYDTIDLIFSAAEQKPLEFETAFKSILVDKLQNAVENRKMELAASLYQQEQDYDYEESEE